LVIGRSCARSQDRTPTREDADAADGIEALYRRPRTTKPEPGHKIYPYLLRGLAITRPNQVWAMDITYIPMARGFVYLAVVLDWFSRRVLSWRLSITMEAAFCVETLEDTLARYGKPDVFNTDQGSQFTGQAFTGALTSNGITISMDGKAYHACPTGCGLPYKCIAGEKPRPGRGGVPPRVFRAHPRSERRRAPARWRRGR
jgi:transposase InsO family protein